MALKATSRFRATDAVRILTNAPGSGFVTTFADWLDVINGCQPTSYPPEIGLGPRVYCYNGRALSQYVHTDVLFQAYFVACLNLLGNTYPADLGNPYGQFIDHTGTGLPLPKGVTGGMTAFDDLSLLRTFVCIVECGSISSWPQEVGNELLSYSTAA